MAPEPASASDALEIGGLRIEPHQRIGPYVYRRVVGKGAMALVALADDPDGQPVALKILKVGRIGTGLSRFRREFTALARLRHPNVIRVDAYGDLHGHPYIAMEYVEGTDLHAAIHGFAVLSAAERWKRCEAILVDLCRALAYIHRRGVVHRDLKPSNVLIDGEGRCKLTDFGIVKLLDPTHDTQLSTTLVGTWAYASIEQMSGQPIDHRSDLYSLGVMLFAMLTGRRPYAAQDLAGYLELQRTQRIPAPRDVDPSIPAHLDEICRRLLQREPRDRYRSAQEILYRLERLEEGVGSDARSWTPPLVGRSTEDTRLRACVSALTRGEGGGLVAVEGAEGVGKSRMLESVRDQAEAMGFQVFDLRILDRDTPLSPVMRLLDGVARELDNRAPASVARAVRAWGSADGESVTRDQLQEALIQGMAMLLEDGPRVVLVDDAHLAQGPALEALDALWRRLGEQPLLVALALRTEGFRPARLDTLRDAATERIVLDPLDRTSVRAIVESLVGGGRAAEVLTERLVRETEGNVLFLVLFLQSLVASGMIARVPDPGPRGPRFRLIADAEEIASGHVDVPAGVRNVVRARLTPLPGEQRGLAEVLAVHGRDMDLDVLLDVLERDEDEVAELLESLTQLGLIRTTPTGASVTLEFTHAKFGDVLYRELDADRRAELHRRVAAALEARFAHTPTATEFVGEHYRLAGDSGKAWLHLAAAARRVVGNGMAAEVMEMLRRAALLEDGARVDLARELFSATAHDLVVVRAEALALRGETQRAKEATEEALASLDGLVEAHALGSRVAIGRVLRTIGDPPGAEQAVHAALPRARQLHLRDVVAEGLIVLAGAAWSRGDHDGCEACAQEGLLLAIGPQFALQRARLLLPLTSVQATRGQLASAASGLSEAQLLFKDLRNRHSRALALANLAEVLLSQGDVQAAWTHATEALEEARTAGYRVGEVAAQEIRGYASLVVGATEVAMREFRASLTVTREMGRPSEGLTAEMLLGRLALENNQPDAASAHLDTAARCAEGYDPEHYVPLIQALRAQALGRRALTLPETSGARTALVELAWAACRVAEDALAGLPLMRKAQATLDVARARAILGDFEGALPRARAAAHLASMRGFRLLTLDALAVAAFVTADEEERGRLTAEVADWVVEVAPCIPLAWHAGFRQRLGLPPDA